MCFFPKAGKTSGLKHTIKNAELVMKQSQFNTDASI